MQQTCNPSSLHQPFSAANIGIPMIPSTSSSTSLSCHHVTSSSSTIHRPESHTKPEITISDHLQTILHPSISLRLRPGLHHNPLTTTVQSMYTANISGDRNPNILNKPESWSK
ncbi:hypothetical protein Hanom_Chr01g00054631 [Helianthus anomalus]